jgi:hypothetical protein
MLHRLLTTMLCMGLLLVAAAPATAQTSVTQGYDESGVIGNIDESPEVIPGTDEEPAGETIPEESDEVTPTAPAPTVRETGAAPTEAAELPFTGFEAGLIAFVGLMLLGTGVVLRRSQRSQG